MSDENIILLVGVLFVFLFIGDPDVYDMMIKSWDSYINNAYYGDV